MTTDLRCISYIQYMTEKQTVPFAETSIQHFCCGKSSICSDLRSSLPASLAAGTGSLLSHFRPPASRRSLIRGTEWPLSLGQCAEQDSHRPFFLIFLFTCWEKLHSRLELGMREASVHTTCSPDDALNNKNINNNNNKNICISYGEYNSNIFCSLTWKKNNSSQISPYFHRNTLYCNCMIKDLLFSSNYQHSLLRPLKKSRDYALRFYPNCAHASFSMQCSRFARWKTLTDILRTPAFRGICDCGTHKSPTMQSWTVALISLTSWVTFNAAWSVPSRPAQETTGPSNNPSRRSAASLSLPRLALSWNEYRSLSSCQKWGRLSGGHARDCAHGVAPTQCKAMQCMRRRGGEGRREIGGRAERGADHRPQGWKRVMSIGEGVNKVVHIIKTQLF